MRVCLSCVVCVCVCVSVCVCVCACACSVLLSGKLGEKSNKIRVLGSFKKFCLQVHNFFITDATFKSYTPNESLGCLLHDSTFTFQHSRLLCRCRSANVE